MDTDTKNSHKGFPRIPEMYGPFCKVICQKKGRNNINWIHVWINTTKILVVFLDGPFQAQHQSLGTSVQRLNKHLKLTFPFTFPASHALPCTVQPVLVVLLSQLFATKVLEITPRLASKLF